MTPEQYDNLKIGDMLTNVELDLVNMVSLNYKPKIWVIFQPSPLGGWDAILQGSIVQFARVQHHDQWNLYSTIIERRRWY